MKLGKSQQQICMACICGTSTFGLHYVISPQIHILKHIPTDIFMKFFTSALYEHVSCAFEFQLAWFYQGLLGSAEDWFTLLCWNEILSKKSIGAPFTLTKNKLLANFLILLVQYVRIQDCLQKWLHKYCLTKTAETKNTSAYNFVFSHLYLYCNCFVQYLQCGEWMAMQATYWLSAFEVVYSDMIPIPMQSAHSWALISECWHFEWIVCTCRLMVVLFLRCHHALMLGLSLRVLKPPLIFYLWQMSFIQTYLDNSYQYYLKQYLSVV